MICTFAGHREIYKKDIDDRVEKILEELILQGEDFVFYSGGMGEFDRMCESKVRLLKKRFPDYRINLVLLLPYMTDRINKYKDYYEKRYDEIVLCSASCDVYYKSAIKKRNRWMIDKADCVIAYVYKGYGGAFDSVKYAKSLGKRIINVSDDANIQLLLGT